MNKYLLLWGAILMTIMLQARHGASIPDMASGTENLAEKNPYPGRDSTEQTYAIQLSDILKPDGTPDLSKGLQGSVNLAGFQMRTRPDGTPYFVEESAATVGPDDNWQAFGGLLSGLDAMAFALAVIDNNLYVGGQFTTVGGTPANNIAKWNGTTWSAMGSGVNSQVRALTAIGTDLYAGGYFTTAGGAEVNRIAKWNGTSWSALGSGINGPVLALTAIGTDLYAGGVFTTAGGAEVNRIAKWDGTSWSALGSGIGGWVNALTVLGTNLYVGGQFTTAGGTAANNIAKWNGSTWSALGSGVSNSVVNALTVMGTDLYVGGVFDTAGGTTVNNIAKWNGTSWSALGSGVNGTVYTLTVMGTDLYAGGGFTTAGGTATNYIAKWNGTSWSALGSGVNGQVFALTVSGTDLYVGGEFTTAGVTAANNIAKWRVCPTYYRDQDGDGFGNAAVTQQACSQPSGYVTNNTDCDDTDAREKPGQVWYKDTDGDGYAQTGAATVTQCLRPAGYKVAAELTSTTGDCNDTNAAIKPGATEICDQIDNNCNGSVDDVSANTPGTWASGGVGGSSGNTNFPACFAAPNDIFTVQANGFSTLSSDQFKVVYQQLCGNGEIIARVRSVSSGGWAGVILRESLSTGSKKVALKTQLSNSIRREIRSVANGTTNTQTFVRPQHAWLRLTRSGSTLTGYTSADGQSWSFAFTATISMGACIYAGVFSESINASTITTATFDNVNVIGSASPLQQQYTGFEESTQNWDIEIYPNPSHGLVNLHLLHPLDQPVAVRVLNTLGEQLMYLPELPEGELQRSLDLTGLPAGVYHLLLETEGQLPLSKRVVLTKE